MLLTGTAGVAQTLLSVLVRLGTTEKDARVSVAGFGFRQPTPMNYRLAATVSCDRFCASLIIVRKSWR